MNFSKLLWKPLSVAAGFFAFAGANTMCWWIAHQTDLPEEVKKMRRI
ncbi:cyclic lactone autoinducer peptide [Paenibacillus sp. P46E]|nr:cyclic lactone autoinducer peptide [Paenibacillus sp. P46E]